MTPEQLEAAARELCRIRGQDPDWRPSWFDVNHGNFGLPRWRLAAEEIKAHFECQQALDSRLRKLAPSSEPNP